MVQEDFNQAVLAVTSGPDWDVVVKGLANDIYHIQASSLDAKSWDEVCEARGFARGLSYMINLREAVVAQMNADTNNADL